MSWKIYGTVHGVARTAQCNEMTIKSSPEKNIKCGEPAGQAEQSKLRQESKSKGEHSSPLARTHTSQSRSSVHSTTVGATQKKRPNT